MSHDTHYEIYEIRNGQWILSSRFSTLDETAARERVTEHFNVEKVPCLLIEETVDHANEIKVRPVWNSPGAAAKARPPGGGADLMSRIFMVVASGIGIGAIGAVIATIMMSAARGRVSVGVVILAFLAFTLIGILLLFRFAVPTELLLWRNKPEAVRKKVIQTLVYGHSDDDIDSLDTMNTSYQGRMATAGNSDENLSGPESIFDPVDGAVEPSEAATAALLQDFLRKAQEKLKGFADTAIASLEGQGLALTAYERTGLNLYLAGANQIISEQESMTPKSARQVLVGVLRQLGTPELDADSFCEQIDTFAYRPRHKRMLDAGRSAMAAQSDGQSIPSGDTATAAMAFWSTESETSAPPQTLVIMVTQAFEHPPKPGQTQKTPHPRLMRAHNSIVRSALKSSKGIEARNLGNGIVATFRDPMAAAAAATEIQQEGAAYVRANADVRLGLSIGLDIGEVTIDNGEHSGDVIAATERICGAGGAGDVICSQAIRDRTAGSIYRFSPLVQTLADKEAAPPPLHRLTWEPKRVYGKSTVEYRNIGAKPKPGDDA